MSTTAAFYYDELNRLPSLDVARERELVMEAHAGNSRARAALIESCLHYAARIAATYKRFLRQDDYPDLCQVGNLAAVEHLDKALSTTNPCAYVRSKIKFAILSYSLHEIAARTESLNRQMTEDGLTLADLLAAPEQHPVSEAYGRYHRLYQELHRLPERYREILARHYGLYGRPEESLYCISRDISAKPGPKSSAAYKIELRALRRLRKMLEVA